MERQKELFEEDYENCAECGKKGSIYLFRRDRNGEPIIAKDFYHQYLACEECRQKDWEKWEKPKEIKRAKARFRRSAKKVVEVIQGWEKTDERLGTDFKKQLLAKITGAPEPD